MGTTMAYNARGRLVLDCAMCGHVGGVSKRRCPSGYCPSVQLCAVCNAKVRQDGTWKTWHATCAASHAAYVAREASKNANPDQWAKAAWGDWADGVPKGMVRVLTRAGNTYFVAKAAYNPEVEGFGRWPGYTPEAQAYELSTRVEA
jgi:hypothetical protein